MNHRLLEEAFRTIRDALGTPRPLGTIILGSGWSQAGAVFACKQAISYNKIPALGPVEIEGHEGKLLLAEVHGRDILIFQGRRHWYEGSGWEPVAVPVYVTHRLGSRVLILTNAAGGIRDDLAPGDLMVIRDHINALGSQPLIGRNDPLWGGRFPAMIQVYDRKIQQAIIAAAHETGLRISTGIYLAASGPAYETPAEISAFRGLKADAVGMSTVPEAILAHALGIRVGGVCCITNRAAGDEKTQAPAHKDVLTLMREMTPRLGQLLLNVWGKIVQEDSEA